MLHNIPDWSNIVEDSEASDSWAARMPGDHHEWAIKCPISSTISGKWHCYAVVKCDSSSGSGLAFSIGAYDERGPREVFNRQFGIEDCGGNKYRTLDLGVHELSPTVYSG